jgi:hypothetical protein
MVNPGSSFGSAKKPAKMVLVPIIDSHDCPPAKYNLETELRRPTKIINIFLCQNVLKAIRGNR